MAKSYDQACPIARTLEIIGERWTILVIRDLLSGPQRFQDLQVSLASVAPAILSDRLKTLEEHGLVERKFYSEHPPRASYTLTARGRELGPVVGAMAVWGAKHLGGPVRVVHAACGHAIELQAYCPHCATAVPREAVTVQHQKARAKAAG